MRIKLKTLEHYIFSTELTIRVDDLNYADHLSNDRILTYAHQARVELFAAWGYRELEFGGVGIIMTDAAVVYKSEGHLGDKLKIEVGIDELSRVGFDMYYRITNVKTGQEVAQVKTGIICYDYSLKKVVTIPKEALLKLETDE
ncbi:MAG: thioesterase [Aureispira sp.]|nr:thioesterase [Aureispira sp.]